MSDINWKAFRSSLNPDDLEHFNRLCSWIKHCKTIIEITNSFRPLFLHGLPPCDDHWLANCYECSPIKSLDLKLKKARKDLNSGRFLLRKMLLEHGIIEPLAISENKLAPVFLTTEERHPIERVFALSRNDATSRYTGKDALDNMRLIEAWMAERGI